MDGIKLSEIIAGAEDEDESDEADDDEAKEDDPKDSTMFMFKIGFCTAAVSMLLYLINAMSLVFKIHPSIHQVQYKINQRELTSPRNTLTEKNVLCNKQHSTIKYSLHFFLQNTLQFILSIQMMYLKIQQMLFLVSGKKKGM